MFSFDSRIRYSETDYTGHLSIRAMLELFQDCATLHTDAAGLSLAVLRGRGQAWVLNAWQADIERLPVMDEQVRVSTYPYGFHGFVGFRNFTLETPGGERLVTANSQWTLVDPATAHPVHVPDDIPVKYGAGDKLEMDYVPRRIKLPETEPVLLPEVKIVRHMLDTNGHVNNARYAELACDCLPDGFEFDRLRIEYKNPALPGGAIVPKVYPEGGAVTVALCPEEGKTFSVLEFSKREK